MGSRAQINQPLGQFRGHHCLGSARSPYTNVEGGVWCRHGKTQPELQEAPCIKLEEVQGDKKQIVSTRSFGSMVTELLVLKDALSTFVANACGKLRAQKSHASVIQVYLRTNRFRQELSQ